MKIEDELNNEDIEALNNFRDTMLSNASIAITELENALTKVYPNLNHEWFIDLIDQTIDEFTYEALNDEMDLLDDDIDYNMISDY